MECSGAQWGVRNLNVQPRAPATLSWGKEQCEAP